MFTDKDSKNEKDQNLILILKLIQKVNLIYFPLFLFEVALVLPLLEAAFFEATLGALVSLGALTSALALGAAFFSFFGFGRGRLR